MTTISATVLLGSIVSLILVVKYLPINDLGDVNIFYGIET